MLFFSQLMKIVQLIETFQYSPLSNDNAEKLNSSSFSIKTDIMH